MSLKAVQKQTRVSHLKYSLNYFRCTCKYADDFDENVAEQLAKGGCFYIIHRFDEAGAFFIKRMHDQGPIASISVGVMITY